MFTGTIDALQDREASRGTDVHAVLCLVESEWSLLDFPYQLGTVWVMYPGALKKRLRKSGRSRERRWNASRGGSTEVCLRLKAR